MRVFLLDFAKKSCVKS